MSAPRLFPDMAAAPTRRERAAARVENEAGQLELFGEVVPVEVDDGRGGCAVCGGDHGGGCRHGEAVELFEVEAALPLDEDERAAGCRAGAGGVRL